MISVNDRVGLFGKSINSTDLVEILLPFWRMLNDNSKIYVFILGFYPSSNLFAIGGVKAVSRACNYVTTHYLFNIIFIITTWIIWSKGWRKYQPKYSNSLSKHIIKKTYWVIKMPNRTIWFKKCRSIRTRESGSMFGEKDGRKIYILK